MIHDFICMVSNLFGFKCPFSKMIIMRKVVNVMTIIRVTTIPVACRHWLSVNILRSIVNRLI